MPSAGSTSVDMAQADPIKPGGTGGRIYDRPGGAAGGAGSNQTLIAVLLVLAVIAAVLLIAWAT
jgi:hypothetical protein